MSRDELYTIINGECLSRMKSMKSCSVDAIVTDPPYGLAFMGANWDHNVPSVSYWSECLRVAKSGAHLLCFGGTRTFHRLMCAIEDAGWEIRDTIMWVYGSGFPKSMDVAKAIDKGQAKSLSRALEFTSWMRSTGITAKQVDAATGTRMSRKLLASDKQALVATEEMFDKLRPYLPEVPQRIEQLVAERTGVSWEDYRKRHVIARAKGSYGVSASGFLEGLFGEFDLTEPYSKEAKKWDGWGTCLKPAWEPIIVARKPLEGTVAHNVMEYGTGAINIDGCRVPTNDKLGGGMRAGGADGVWDRPFMHDEQAQSAFVERKKANVAKSESLGRFPANLVHDGSQEVLELFPDSKGQQGKVAGNEPSRTGDNGTYGHYGQRNEFVPRGDSGSAARFFYCAKASKRDRGEGNDHPTVKPNDLMRWLVRLVCPKGGVVLDPFMGSGSTGVACIDEEMRFIGIEMDKHYCEIADGRMSKKLEGGVQMTML